MRPHPPLIPHVTFGTLPTLRQACDLCEALNGDAVLTAGRIERDNLSVLRDGKVGGLAAFALAG